MFFRKSLRKLKTRCFWCIMMYIDRKKVLRHLSPQTVGMFMYIKLNSSVKPTHTTAVNIDAPSISGRFWPRIVPRRIIADICNFKYIISAASLMLYQSPVLIFNIVFEKKKDRKKRSILLFCPINIDCRQFRSVLGPGLCQRKSLQISVISNISSQLLA